jgi:hypothetical protein
MKIEATVQHLATMWRAIALIVGPTGREAPSTPMEMTATQNEILEDFCSSGCGGAGGPVRDARRRPGPGWPQRRTVVFAQDPAAAGMNWMAAVRPPGMLWLSSAGP